MGMANRSAGIVIFILTLAVLPATAQNLALSIGDAPFEFRIDGCTDLSGAQVSAMSRGIVEGELKTV
jgi:hypothetical protein